MSNIVFFGKRTPLKQINKVKLTQCIRTIAGQYNKNARKLSYILITDEALLQMNQTHLQHNYYTDIITFDLSEVENEIIGEIYISYERVSENAKYFHVPQNEEMLRVIFHGLLHLCGLQDKSKTQKKEMREMELHCLNLYREMGN